MMRRVIPRIAAWTLLAIAVYYFLYVYPKRSVPANGRPDLIVVQIDAVSDRPPLEVSLSVVANRYRSEGVLFEYLLPGSASPVVSACTLLCSASCQRDDVLTRPFAERSSLISHLREQGYAAEACIAIVEGDNFAQVLPAFDKAHAFLGPDAQAGTVLSCAADALASHRQEGAARQPLLLYVRLTDFLATPNNDEPGAGQTRSDSSVGDVQRSLAALIAATVGDEGHPSVVLIAACPASRDDRPESAEPRGLALLVATDGSLPRGLLVQRPTALADLAPTLLGMARLPPLLTAQGIDRLSPLVQK